jgi:hypothetical protein
MKFQQKLTSARIAGQQLTATSGDMATWDYFLNNKFRLSATLPTVFDRDSPDDSRFRENFGAFPSFWQDRLAARTTAVASGSPNGDRGVDLAIFAGIWTHSSRRLLLSA